MGLTRAARRPGTVVAALALVAAVAGTAIAGTDATTSALNKKKVKKIAVKQINKLAPGLSVASAENSAALEGRPASAFASSDVEPNREVGRPGQPAFKNGWGNASVNESSAGFYKDPFGVVHLKGELQNAASDDSVAFTLPQGYRPTKTVIMPATGPGASSASATVFTTGDVRLICDETAGTCFVGIDALTFRP